MGEQILVQFVSLFVSLSLEKVAPLTEAAGRGKKKKRKTKKQNKYPPHAAALAGVTGEAMCTFAERKQRERLGM